MSDWEEHWDEDDQRCYYHNSVTGDTTWDKPEGFESAERSPKRQKMESNSDEWEEHWDEDSNKNYYYNTRTEETTWDQPDGFVSGVTGEATTTDAIDDAALVTEEVADESGLGTTDSNQHEDTSVPSDAALEQDVSPKEEEKTHGEQQAPEEDKAPDNEAARDIVQESTPKVPKAGPRKKLSLEEQYGTEASRASNMVPRRLIWCACHQQQNSSTEESVHSVPPLGAVSVLPQKRGGRLVITPHAGGKQYARIVRGMESGEICDGASITMF